MSSKTNVPKADLPVSVVFKPNTEGELAARIDNLEVGFFPDDGCYIVIWDDKTGEELDSTVMTNEGTRAELEIKIRDMFARGHDGVSENHEQEWPQPAAYIFASVPWKLDE
jgi:hypothetical protein